MLLGAREYTSQSDMKVYICGSHSLAWPAAERAHLERDASTMSELPRRSLMVYSWGFLAAALQHPQDQISCRQPPATHQLLYIKAHGSKTQAMSAFAPASLWLPSRHLQPHGVHRGAFGASSGRALLQGLPQLGCHSRCQRLLWPPPVHRQWGLTGGTKWQQGWRESGRKTEAGVCNQGPPHRLSAWTSMLWLGRMLVCQLLTRGAFNLPELALNSPSCAGRLQSVLLL